MSGKTGKLVNCFDAFIVAFFQASFGLTFTTNAVRSSLISVPRQKSQTLL